MTDRRLDAIRDLIQEDVGRRGLATDPRTNLFTACRDDFAAACHSLAGASGAAVGVVTGFFIPHGQPPCGETDGPLGALFLARALVPLGVQVTLLTDAFCEQALREGLHASGLDRAVRLLSFPSVTVEDGSAPPESWRRFVEQLGSLTHLIALERVGPSHTPASVRAQPGSTAEAVAAFVQEVPPEHHGRCHTMRGLDVTAHTGPAHLLFEAHQPPGVTTIGIGDGGNEIGMGRIPWETIRRNIPRGGLVACRVPADHLIVCGVSNWGAYGLAAGVALLRGRPPDPGLFDPERERELLRVMVEHGPLVDGVLGRPSISVDGLEFDRYAEPLRRLAGPLAA